MSLWKRGRQYWADFTVDGRRYRKRLDTTNLQDAKRKERQLIEGAGHGAVATHEQGPKRLFEALLAKRVETLAEARTTLGANPLPPMTSEEIQAEIDAYRSEVRRATRP